MRDPFNDPSVNATAKPAPVDHRDTPYGRSILGSGPTVRGAPGRRACWPRCPGRRACPGGRHRHDGQPCYGQHPLVRRPDGQLVRITTLLPDPSLIRLPDGWTLTGETWA